MNSSASSPKAVQFDPQKRAASLRFRAAIQGLITILEEAETRLSRRQRQRKREDRAKFRLAVEAIACNLVALVLAASPMPLAVPRGNSVIWSSTRYRPQVYGQHFLDALDLMTAPSVGLAETVTRGFKLADGRKQQTTIRPALAFLQAIEIDHCGWDDLERLDDPEVLILRGRKDNAGNAELLEFGETRTTRRMRKEVQRLNAYLAAATVTLSPASSPPGPGIIPADPTRRTVRRIFNNASFMQGGRLFDGYWETMPKEERFERLRIATASCPSGEPVSNVDFGQLFTALVYAKCTATRPEGDLYDVRGDGSCRDGFKLMLNALLFRAEPLKRWPEDACSCFPKGAKLRTVIAEIERHHAPIAHLFCTAIGFRLMLMESTILIDACLRLFAQGITALPLHDSVLVAETHEDAAREAMQAAHEFYAQSRAQINIDKPL